MKTNCGKLVGLLLITVGCALDPKTVGMGTDTDDGSGSASEGSATSNESTGPSVSGSSGDDGTCEGANCVWDPCADAVCGAFCNMCAPWDEDCSEPGTYTVCTPEGSCEPWGEWDVDPCPGVGLQPGFESELADGGGCADMTVYIANADQTVALHLQVDGLVAMAEDTGAPVMVEYAGNDPSLAIEVTFGSDLLTATCTDAVTVDPTVLEHWVAAASEDDGSAGTVAIVVTPNADTGPTATVTFDGIVLRRDDADVFDVELRVEHLVIEDVSVGWLPG